MIMVKPSLPYLDVIADAAQLAPDHPIACYQVSGEYAMVCAGADKGVYALKDGAFETIDGFLRAGRFTPLFPFFVVCFTDGETQQVRRSSLRTLRLSCWTGWMRTCRRKG